MRLLQFLDATSPDLLLEAAKDRYMQMLPEETIMKFFVISQAYPAIHRYTSHQPLPREVKGMWEKEVDWAVSELKRADRIMWYLRYIKIMTMRIALSGFKMELEAAEEASKAENWSTKPELVEALQQWWQQYVRLDKKVSSELFKLQKNTAQAMEQLVKVYAEQWSAANDAMDVASKALRAERNRNTRSRYTNAQRALGRASELQDAVRRGASASTVDEYVAGLTNPHSTSSMAHHKMELSHFMGIPDQRVQDFEWGFYLWTQIKNLLTVWEKEWAQKAKRTIPQEDESWEGAEKIIEFDDGMAWWNLHRSYCDREGEAMGHCGNSYRSDRPVEIISLREPVDDGWKVNLTFIWNHETGMIEESKAFDNQKPDQKYHPYIIKLIQQPWVNGFDQEGTHEPENNFQMEDLEEEVREELIAFNPGLTGAVHDDYLDTKYRVDHSYSTETPPWLWAMESDDAFESGSIEYHLMHAIDSPNGTYWKSSFLVVLDDDSHLIRYIGERHYGEANPMDLVTKHRDKLFELLSEDSLIEGIDFSRMEMGRGLHEGDFPPDFLKKLYYEKPIMMGAIPDKRLDIEYDFLGSMYNDESGWFRNKEETNQDAWTLFVPIESPRGDILWKQQGQAFFYMEKSLARERLRMTVYHFSDERGPGWPWGKPITPPEEELYKYKDFLLHTDYEYVNYGQYNQLRLENFSEEDQREIVAAKPKMFELYTR